MPAITDPVIADGRTEPGYAGTPLVRLDNATGNSTITGLDVSAGSTEIFGLSVTGFSKGVEFRSGGGNTLAASWIGINAVGFADPNTVGVSILNGSSGNLVGGSSASARNVISGNAWSGVDIAGIGTSDNAITGNYIGTNPAGSAPVPNALYGISIFDGATGSVVGGTGVSDRNVISGNSASGVAISGAGTTTNRIQGNYIGTNAGGNGPVPNENNGISILDGAASNTVGGTSAGARNVISGNAWSGVDMSGAGTSQNLVQGNYVGTTASGTAALPNSFFGVVMFFGASGNVIGGTVSGARNVLSGNLETGVAIVGTGVTHNVVRGNYVGTSSAGTGAIGNQGGGIRIAGAVLDNTIGGLEAGARNVVSGNGGDGIQIADRASRTLVQGNYVGTDATGTGDLGNVQAGILISDVTETTVGGTTAAARNVVSGNGGVGVRILGAQTRDSVVAGNYIGTNAAGNQAIGNGSQGVLVSASSDNTIGGTVAGSGNSIAFNASDGVRIDGTSGAANGNSILRNAIFSNGALGIDLVSGGNNSQPAPTITSVTRSGRKTTVKGTLTGQCACDPAPHRGVRESELRRIGCGGGEEVLQGGDDRDQRERGRTVLGQGEEDCVRSGGDGDGDEPGVRRYVRVLALRHRIAANA